MTNHKEAGYIRAAIRVAQRDGITQRVCSNERGNYFLQPASKLVVGYCSSVAVVDPNGEVERAA